MTHETDEDLSALIDGELPPEAAARVRAHAASCSDCAARLDRFGGASIAFRRSGERPIPAGLLTRIKNAVQSKRSDRSWVPSLEIVLAMTMAVAMILVSGAMLKRFIPSLFNNVQQMITGAAGQIGGK